MSDNSGPAFPIGSGDWRDPTGLTKRELVAEFEIQHRRIQEYADELRAELERQIEFRRLPPALMKLIEAYAEARVNETGREIAKLRRDRLTLALRLHGESRDTFAPETAEVMKRMQMEISAAFEEAASA